MAYISAATKKLLDKYGVSFKQRPTQETVLSFLRKKHKIYVIAGPSNSMKFGYQLSQFCRKPYPAYYHAGSTSYDLKTYCQAVEKGIQHAIKLIYGIV
jgi:hypothetical protein